MADDGRGRAFKGSRGVGSHGRALKRACGRIGLGKVSREGHGGINRKAEQNGEATGVSLYGGWVFLGPDILVFFVLCGRCSGSVGRGVGRWEAVGG